MFNKRYRLIQRVAKLEKLMLERSVGRGGQSIAMNIWSFLMDHGPATKEEIDSALGSRYSNTTALNSWVKPGLIVKHGNQYVANPNYIWDDVGVINRGSAGPSAAEIAAAMQDANNGDFGDEQPSTRSRGRATRAPRQPRPARAVTPNLFSRKFAEVKQAVDDGEDVNQKNDNGKTPLMWALTSNKPEAEEIARYLIDHGAKVNMSDSRNMATISYAVKYNHPNIVRYMFDHDDEDLARRINSRLSYIGAGRGRTSLLEVAAQNGWPLKDLPLLIRPGFFNSAWAYELLSNVLGTYYKDSNPAEKQAFVNHCINTHLNSESDKEIAVSNMSSITGLYSDKNKSIGKYFRNAIRDAGYMPFLGNTYRRDVVSGNEQEIYDIARDLISGKITNTLSTSSFSTFLQYLGDACAALNRPSLVGEVLNQNVIDSMPNKWAWSLLDNAISDGSSSVNDMLKLKYKKPSPDIIRNILISLTESEFLANSSSKAITRQVCKLLSKYINSLSLHPRINHYTLSSITKSNNRFLIDFMIDHGFGQELADCRGDKSNECIDALNDANITSADDKSQEERTAIDDKRSFNELVSSIIDAISADRMNIQLQDKIRSYPNALLDPRVQEAIDEADPDNITARQLRIQADRVRPDEVKDTYDF